MRFENKVVLITAAASGMGRAGALLFAAEGAKVVAELVRWVVCVRLPVYAYDT